MKKKKILIVDDELDMQLFLKTLIEMSGYHPVIAKDGRDGVQKAVESVPDLIILDVMMPGEGGVQMYSRLRINDKLKEIPIIMLSAVAKKTFYHYLKMLNLQLEDKIPEPEVYMEKPSETENLLKTIKTLLS